MKSEPKQWHEKKDAYGRQECIDCGGWFEAYPDRVSAIHICTPMVLRLREELSEAWQLWRGKAKAYKEVLDILARKA